MTGTLYGIGVGPGDPELMTIKATKRLETIDVVFAASSTKNDYSTALDIARPYMPENITVVRLGFPMTKDKEAQAKAWEHNVSIVAETLDSGHSGAFLTLGDPLIYSTFGYLMRTLEALRPDIPVEVIPGITSYQASAAHTRTILCEADENLLLLSGVSSKQLLQKMLHHADNSVILKAYRNFDQIKEALSETEKETETVFISRLGMEGEQVAATLHNAPQKPHYFSHLLIPKTPRV